MIPLLFASFISQTYRVLLEKVILDENQTAYANCRKVYLKTQNKLTLSHNYPKNAGGNGARATRKARSHREPRSYQLF
jgi:hypothetical protein